LPLPALPQNHHGWVGGRSEPGAEQAPGPGLGLRLRRGEGSGQRSAIFGGQQEQGGLAPARLERVLRQRSEGEREKEDTGLLKQPAFLRARSC